MPSTPPPPRRRVLFVEDESGLRHAYKRFFDGRYEIAFATTGTEARAQATAFAPEVVVLDLRLPDTDGIELLRQLRALRPDLAVVITSAYSSMQPLVDVMGIPHSGYLVKPFQLTDLAARIDAAS